MQLLILSTEFPPGPGGIGTHAFQLADNLCMLDWDVTVITKQNYTTWSKRISFNKSQMFDIVPLPEINVKLVDGLRRGQIVRHYLQRRKPDLLVATGTQSTWIASTMPKIAPVVAIGHGSEFGLRGWEGRLTRWAFQRADHVVCVSNYTKQYMFGRSIQPKAVSVIHNGADDRRYVVLSDAACSGYRTKLGFSDQDKLILTVGNVSERKGQDIVIRALPDILVSQPQTHYLIAGLPSEQARFAVLADELGVASRVHFLGRVSHEELVQLYNVADVFLMTSREARSGDFEGFGIAVIEAALCGTPAVVAGGSGLAEAVTHGVTGFTVPSDNPSQTAQAVLDLLQDDLLRTKISTQARQNALNHQTWQKKITMYDRLFRTIIL